MCFNYLCKNTAHHYTINQIISDTLQEKDPDLVPLVWYLKKGKLPTEKEISEGIVLKVPDILHLLLLVCQKRTFTSLQQPGASNLCACFGHCQARCPYYHSDNTHGDHPKACSRLVAVPTLAELRAGLGRSFEPLGTCCGLGHNQYVWDASFSFFPGCPSGQQLIQHTAVLFL